MIYNITKRTLAKILMCHELYHPKVQHLKLQRDLRLRKFSLKNSNAFATCGLCLSMLCTELDFNPKIKVFDLVKYYNFA